MDAGLFVSVVKVVGWRLQKGDEGGWSEVAVGGNGWLGIEGVEGVLELGNGGAAAVDDGVEEKVVEKQEVE